MDNKISINKIIADIKATKGNRSGCQGLHSSLESDGYITSICKWTRATNPERIDALVEHVEKQDAALIAWEKTMMEVCGEDSPPSVASEIRSLRTLRDTAMQALKSQVKQLAAENVGLNKFIKQSCYVYNGDGSDISDSYTPAHESPMMPIKAQSLLPVAAECLAIRDAFIRYLTSENLANKPDANEQQVYDHCAKWVDAMCETPATDRIVAEAEAQGAEAYETALLTSDDDDFTYEASICVEETHQQREEAK